MIVQNKNRSKQMENSVVDTYHKALASNMDHDHLNIHAGIVLEKIRTGDVA